ncbi:MAG: hypothetical protein H0V60_07095 [Actinobacteria bacterium]|jgi:hypothetical protein|nr:hypothetical protein [Actinomycetota bacterium]
MSHITEQERTGTRALWFAALAAPAAWSIQLLTGDQLVELACAPGSSSSAIWGVTFETVILVLTLVCTATTGLAGYVSYRCLRKTSKGDTSTGGRARWMALAGLFVNGLFGILIVQGFLPTLFLSGCETAL